MDVENSFGLRISEARKRKSVSGRELARRLKCPQSYLWKIETGKLRPPEGFAGRVAEALSLTKNERLAIEHISRLHLAEHLPISSEQNAVSERQDAIRELEKSVVYFRMFQKTLIPGLLQSEAYMRLLFARYTAKDVDRSVQERRRRQRVLQKRNRTFHFLIAESALWGGICSAKVLQEQLKQMRDVLRYQNVTLSFIPRNTLLPPLLPVPPSSFNVWDESVVVIDTLKGYITLRHPAEVRSHIDAFESLANTALKSEAALEAMENTVAERASLEE